MRHQRAGRFLVFEIFQGDCSVPEVGKGMRKPRRVECAAQQLDVGFVVIHQQDS
jgi:hypothetical protein